MKRSDRHETMEELFDRLHYGTLRDLLAREERLVPAMRAVIRNYHINLLIQADDAAEAAELAVIARHVHDLSDSDLRFRLIASFHELDAVQLLDDYFTYHVGSDSCGYVAAARFWEVERHVGEGNVDDFITLLLLDALAFEAQYPEMRTHRSPSDQVSERSDRPKISREQRMRLLQRLQHWHTRNGEEVDLICLLGSDPQLITLAINSHLALRSEARDVIAKANQTKAKKRKGRRSKVKAN